MVSIEISIAWIVFFGALFGALIGAVLGISITYLMLKREAVKLEREYKYLLVEGLIGAVSKFFSKEEPKSTATDSKTV